MKLYKKMAKAGWVSRSKGVFKRINQHILRRRLKRLFRKEVDELER